MSLLFKSLTFVTKSSFPPQLAPNRDLFLLNTTDLYEDESKGLIKICDDNIYVDKEGNVLNNIQWFNVKQTLLIHGD